MFGLLGKRIHRLWWTVSRLLGKDVHQSWMVATLCVGIIVGVVLGLVFGISYFASSVWLTCVGLLLILTYFRPKLILVIAVMVGGVVLALCRIATELYGEDYIRQFYGKTVLVSGVIEGDPETDEKGTAIKLKDLKYGEGCTRANDSKMSGECYSVKGRLFVSVNKNENLVRGDEIVLKGKLSEGFGTYAGYMYKPIIVEVWRPEPGDLVLGVRDWFAGRVKKLIPEPEVNLGLSYLLGMRTGLDDEFSEKLRTVGLVHIVVASGAHLSILVEIARKIFGKLTRFAGVFFSVVFVVFFMAMVGWTPSILRAGVMAILTLVAWYRGRKFAAWRIILITAAFTLMLEPMFAINLGWLLSFASYGGIMVLGPILVRFFYGEKKPGFLASIIITTIAATLMTLPIILYFYGQVSLISVVANLLILPTLSYAMGLVFLVGVVAGVPGVETLVSFLAVKLLDFHIVVVEWFGGQKQFLVEIEPY